MAEIKKLLGCANISQLMKRIVGAQAMTTFGRSGNYSCSVSDIKFFVKIALYSLFVHDLWKPPEPPNRMMVDAEIDIMRAIKTRIIDRGYCPHFVEILAVARCDHIEQFIIDREKCTQQQLGRTRRDEYPQSLFCMFLDLIDGGNAIDKFALVFSEFCEFNVKEYIMRYAPSFPSIRDLLIQSIMFQIYYTLMVSQRLWAHFRHGDLFPHNIMIKLAYNGEKYLDKRHYLRYVDGNKVWNVPFFGFFVKIIDFGHSEIPEEGITNSVRRANDLWVSDHITFIVHFEALVLESRFMTDNLRLIFNALNREHFTPLVATVRLMQFKDTFIVPEDALRSVFNMFETEAPQETIIQEYKAPPSAS